MAMHKNAHSRRRPIKDVMGSGCLQCFLATILIVFGLMIFWMSGDVSKADEIIGIARTKSLRATSGIFALRTVEIKNDYDYDVSIYFEDGLSGSYLSNIAPHQTAKVSASTGHLIYATEISGMTRLSSFKVVPERSLYTLSSSLEGTGGGAAAAVSLPHTGGNIVHAPSSNIHVTKHSQHLGNATITLNVREVTRANPQLVPVPGRRPSAMAVRFRNMVPGMVDLYFIPRSGKPIFEGHIPFTHVTTTNAYVGHHFFVVMHGEDASVPKNRLSFIHVEAEHVLYTFYDVRDPEDNKVLPVPAEAQALSDKEQLFMKEYRERTGIHWRHFFGNLKAGGIGPRPPPVMFMWPTEKIGDVHAVSSPHGYWVCTGGPHKCHDTSAPLSLELEVVANIPKALLIKDFISDFEAEALIGMAETRLGVSHVGGKEQGSLTSRTRTSTNAWLARHTSPLTETIYRRTADVLNIDESLLHHSGLAEDIQVVHYAKDQKYESHHDWGISATEVSRLLTLLIYLTDQPSVGAGGETSFAKGVGRDGNAFKVRPKKGSAILFYNLLEDGNGDDLALHAALPVTQGEKYAANIWVWDPARA